MAVKALMTDETGKQIVDAIREKAGLEARVSDLEKNKVDKSSIAQTTGDAEDKVMSQKKTTEELEKKFDKSNVVQSTGDDEDKVMSQAAATKEFAQLSEEIDDITEKVVVSANLFDGIFDKEGYSIDTSGELDFSATYKATSEYYPLPVATGRLYIALSEETYSFIVTIYDSQKNYLKRIPCNNLDSTNGTFANAAYFRVAAYGTFGGESYISTIAPSNPVDYSYTIQTHLKKEEVDRATEELQARVSNLEAAVRPDKTVVCFGDSLFGNYRSHSGDSQSISSFMNEKINGACYNVGFGGCKMCEVTGNGTGFDAFSMYRLADAVASGDWTIQDTAIAETETHGFPHYFPTHLEKLKEIVWSKVDIITIAYGTNDFGGNRTPEAFDAALRHALETILTAYPHIHIVCVTPTYRFFEKEGNYLYDCDDDQAVNNFGHQLHEFVDKEIETCKELHVDCIDNFYSIGMNRYNRSNYFATTDGTHPNRNGRQLLGYNIADKLMRYI